jgi:hypothetical protein
MPRESGIASGILFILEARPERYNAALTELINYGTQSLILQLPALSEHMAGSSELLLN